VELRAAYKTGASGRYLSIKACSARKRQRLGSQEEHSNQRLQRDCGYSKMTPFHGSLVFAPD